MKYISRFLTICLLLQSFAWASPREGLKTAFDEYRYALTVEWDQQDQEQLKKIQASFTQEMQRLVVEEQLTAEEFALFIKENHRSLQVEEDILDLVRDRQGQFDLGRAQRMLEEGSDLMYSQGASWTAEDVLIYGFIGLIVFEIVVLIITHRDDVCPNPTRYPNDVSFECIYE